MSASLAQREITMPRLSDSMEEGVLVAWLKQPGDAVRAGEPLVEVETDKATMVYEAEFDGILAELMAAEGETVALGAPIALLRVEDGAVPPAPRASAPPAAPDPAASAPSTPAAQPPPRRDLERPRATPVARRVAADRGVDLRTLTGSGPGGRIVRKDVLAAAPAQPPASFSPGAGEQLELSATQRTIARRMTASRAEIPDFTVTAEIDVTDALRLRRELNEALPQARVSINDMVVRAVALTLREQPALNAWWVDEGIVRHQRVHVGLAVATDDEALLVPTIADADRKGLVQLAAESRAAGERARNRACAAEELSGATFTVSNLGMFGALCFEAVINPPQVGILAVGAVTRRPCFDAEGAVVGRELVQVSLCSDHRAVYGATAARFLAELRALLENPIRLVVPPADAGVGGGG